MKLMGHSSGVVGVALVLEKLGGGAGRRSNGKCRISPPTARFPIAHALTSGMLWASQSGRTGG